MARVTIHTKNERPASGLGRFFEALGEGLVAAAEAQNERRRNSEAMIRFSKPYSMGEVIVRVGRIDRIQVDSFWDKATLVLDNGDRLQVEFGRREREALKDAGFYI
jgi:hypothetical protein